MVLLKSPFNPSCAALFLWWKQQSSDYLPGGLGYLPGLWQSRKITRWHHPPVSPDIKARLERERTISMTACRPLHRFAPEPSFHCCIYLSLGVRKNRCVPLRSQVLSRLSLPPFRGSKADDWFLDVILLEPIDVKVRYTPLCIHFPVISWCAIFK